VILKSARIVSLISLLVIAVGTDAQSVSPPQSPSATIAPTVGWHAVPGTSLKESGACPPNGFGGDSYDFSSACRNVIRAWSGAIADTNRNRLLLWGGGHSDYAGNEIYLLDLNSRPVSLRRVKDPTVPTNSPANNPYYKEASGCVYGIPPVKTADVPPGPGPEPNAVHTYGGLAYIAHADSMFAVGGSLACGPGNGSRETWTIRLDRLSNQSKWRRHHDVQGPLPGSEGGNTIGIAADYDPNSGLVFISDSASLYAFDYARNAYKRVLGSGQLVTSGRLSGGIDAPRKLFVLVGNCGKGNCGPGSGVFAVDIADPANAKVQNWTAGTMSDSICAEFLAGGATPLNSGAAPGFAYDSVAKSFVGWPNSGSTVYILTPEPAGKRLRCEKREFVDGPPHSSHAGPRTSNGTFGRFRYLPHLDLFVLVNDWDIPAYLLRLR